MARPPAVGKWMISNGGAGMAAWRGDGKELFYVADDRKLMAVDVHLDPIFQAGVPQPLFQSPVGDVLAGRNHYAVTRDGQRFLMVAEDFAAAGTMQVVLNWPALLKKAAAD